MKQIGFFIWGVVLVFLFNVPTVVAHQPEYVDLRTAVHIPDPNVSRAYYGELTGAPALYTISSDEDFRLYLNILSPYLVDARKDFVVTVVSATGTVIASLNAPTLTWQTWYEEFAGDRYWKGPELRQSVSAGTYTVSVSNPGNRGKYVLAPGEAEEFTFSGTPSTIRQIYLIKTLFFGKPWYAVFEGIIGKVLLAVVLACGIAACSVAFFLYRRLKVRK